MSAKLPRHLIAKVILIIVAVGALPVIFNVLFRSYSNVMDYLLYALYVAVPAGMVLAAAYLLGEDYLLHGEGNILSFGSAALTWGLVEVAFIVSGFFAPTLGPSWTIGSVGILVSSLLHFSGAFPMIGGLPSKMSGLRLRLMLAYSGVAVAVAVVSYASFNGLAPAFFGVGGSTPLDESFSVVSIILLFASSVLVFVKANKSPRLLSQYWYSIGLALFAFTIFLWSIGMQSIVEIGRMETVTTYAGAACFLISAFIYLRESSR